MEKKQCDGCRAYSPNKIRKCDLGYKQESVYIGWATYVEYAAEKCPKPRTWKQWQEVLERRQKEEC